MLCFLHKKTGELFLPSSVYYATPPAFTHHFPCDQFIRLKTVTIQNKRVHSKYQKYFFLCVTIMELRRIWMEKKIQRKRYINNLSIQKDAVWNNNKPWKLISGPQVWYIRDNSTSTKLCKKSQGPFSPTHEKTCNSCSAIEEMCKYR